MIDIHEETIVSLKDAPKHTPGHPHQSTIYRWTQRSHSPLETVRVGGRIFTSIEAIDRFAEQSSGAQPEKGKSKRRQKEIDRAERELERAGI